MFMIEIEAVQFVVVRLILNSDFFISLISAMLTMLPRIVLGDFNCSEEEKEHNCFFSSTY